jgi:hypothetical protein
MKTYFSKFKIYIRKILPITLVFLAFWMASGQPQIVRATTGSVSPLPRVNVPYLTGSPYTPTVFWFGKVDQANNYADVRLDYYDEELQIVVNMIDRLVWYDTTPASADLTNWDALSLYIDMNGSSTGSALSTNAYLFRSQLYSRDKYRWNGTGWASSAADITVDASWRGNGPNDNIDDKGWQITIAIPFTSLGLAKAPVKGTTWKLGLIMYDRDAANGTAIQTVWPTNMQPGNPSTWGVMSFGVPGYTPTVNVVPASNITIRQGLNGAIVPDGEVGGHTVCGDGTGYYDGWGDTNYTGYDQINIQNQWDVSDWPCFSKFYVTFPLDSLPRGKIILSGNLTMHLFGGSGGGEWGTPPDSYIQVLTAGEDWNEATLTWNNAPQAKENISGVWVHPMGQGNIWPGDPYTWDVSRALADAYANGMPLRLILYSADGERHTGKYFSSSDTGDWNAVARPTLNVVVGDACGSSGITCYFNFLPSLYKSK